MSPLLSGLNHTHVTTGERGPCRLLRQGVRRGAIPSARPELHSQGRTVPGALGREAQVHEPRTSEPSTNVATRLFRYADLA